MHKASFQAHQVNNNNDIQTILLVQIVSASALVSTSTICIDNNHDNNNNHDNKVAKYANTFINANY